MSVTPESTIAESHATQTRVQTRRIDGRAAAKALRATLADRVAARVAAGHRAPGLATVLVGDDPASHVYVRHKRKQATAAGYVDIHHHLDADVSQADLLALVAQLCADDTVDGVLVQLPLPPHIDEQAVIHAIDPLKDVDGFHPDNVALLAMGTPRFVPCTPRGCMHLLREAGVEISGAHAVVIGRSHIVGRPMGQLLLAANATVTTCHSRTRDLAAHTRTADIVIAAVGKLHLVTPDMLKPGAVVLDVGMNRKPDGKLAGDVDFEAIQGTAGAASPVPGGVGPMTIAMLLSNTLDAHALHLGLPVDA